MVLSGGEYTIFPALTLLSWYKIIVFFAKPMNGARGK
jgi:hypothetical protein